MEKKATDTETELSGTDNKLHTTCREWFHIEQGRTWNHSHSKEVKMQCITPMFRLYDISTKDTVRIVPRAEVMQGLELNPNNIKFQLSKMNSQYLARNQLMQTIPCGKCWACQLNYSAEWATRCMLETLEHDHCYFITLTYDEEHLPIYESIELKDGTKFENDGTWINGSLVPEHVTKFINSLRKYYERQGIYDIKYFYCGEYGDSSLRPHYHLILFNCPLEDLTYEFQTMEDGRLKKCLRPSNNGDLQYSEIIHKCWDYKGNISVGYFSYDTAAYVAQYCTKKINPKTAKMYEEMNIHPEFLRMSKGVGKDGFDVSLYDLDNICIAGKITSLPRYYDKLFKKLDPDSFVGVQRERNGAKLIRIDTYLHSQQHRDRMDEIRAYRLKKKNKLRDQL